MTTEQYSIGYDEGYQAGWNAAMDAKPAQQEPDELRHIGEQDCLLDVYKKAWHSLVENRGGCRCHISPPCSACSNPISEKEMNEVGYTYTTPPAQPAPVQGWKLVPVKPTREMVDALADTDPEHNSVWDAVLAAAPQPAQRTWIGLTDEQWQSIADTLGCFITRGQKDAIEAALGIKEKK